MKIFVTGLPASGKTFYSDKVADYYNIPRIHVKQMVDDVFRLVDQEEGNLTKKMNLLHQLEKRLVNSILKKLKSKKLHVVKHLKKWKMVGQILTPSLFPLEFLTNSCTNFYKTN